MFGVLIEKLEPGGTARCRVLNWKRGSRSDVSRPEKPESCRVTMSGGATINAGAKIAAEYDPSVGMYRFKRVI